MISFTLIALFLLLGFVTTYFLGIKYLKCLRGEQQGYKDWMLIISSILLGTPAIFIVYAVFKEIRQEDAANHYRLILSTVAIFVVETIILVLLSVYGIINYDVLKPQPNPEVSAQISFLF